jgi:alpha-beta hydrolase superfamily lysophospholipase
MFLKNRKIKTPAFSIITGVLMAVVLIVFAIIYFGSPRFPSAALKDVPGYDVRAERWYRVNKLHKLKGVALVIHGLNLKPERMKSIISALNQADIDVLNLSLHGHGGNYIPRRHIDIDEQRLESFRTVTYEIWSNELYRAYTHIRKKADRKKVPLFLVGYSLGGLLGCDLLISRPDVFFDRMILFAPALNVTIESYLLKVLAPFPALVIDSLSPKSYRANDGTPMAAYKAVFETISHFETNISVRLNVPTIVFIDEKDEFVSCSQLKEMIAQKKLDQWQVQAIRKDDYVNNRTAHHLMIDEDSVGRNTWKHIVSAMKQHVSP